VVRVGSINVERVDPDEPRGGYEIKPVVTLWKIRESKLAILVCGPIDDGPGTAETDGSVLDGLTRVEHLADDADALGSLIWRDLEQDLGLVDGEQQPARALRHCPNTGGEGLGLGVVDKPGSAARVR